MSGGGEIGVAFVDGVFLGVAFLGAAFLVGRGADDGGDGNFEVEAVGGKKERIDDRAGGLEGDETSGGLGNAGFDSGNCAVDSGIGERTDDWDDEDVAIGAESGV